MISHRRLLEITRDTKSTLYVVAVFYVLIGFVLATWGLAMGDRLGTFLGFVIISGALATTALLRAILRMGVQLSSIHESLERLRGDLPRWTTPPTTSSAPSVPCPPPELLLPTIDLANAPLENADALAAATLDRTVFPRLVRAMEEEPPAQSGAAAAPSAEDEENESVDALQWFDSPLSETSDLRGAAAVRNVLRSWRVALRERDLPTCRRIFAALEDTADASIVEPLREPLADLIADTERELRAEFASRLEAQDFDGMLRVGRRLTALLPERPIAAEFRRIEPLLQRRANGRELETEASPKPEAVRAAR